MDLTDLYTVVDNFYKGSTASDDLVLTVVNDDGTVSTYEVDGAGLLATGHPDGSGTRVTNLVIWPIKR